MYTRAQIALSALLLAVLAATSPRPSAAMSTLLGSLSGGPVGASGDATAPLLAAVALLAWTLIGWLGAVVGLLLVSRLPGAAGAVAAATVHRAAPAVIRRSLQAALGLGVSVSVLTSVAAPATADHGGLHAQVGAAAAGQALPLPAVAGAPLSLDWPVTPPPHTAHLPTAERPTADRPAPGRPATDLPDRQASPAPQVTVQPGDSLWRIAAERLPEGASVARIAQAWPMWWAANRDAIGADPDLLHPGTRLSAPPTLPAQP